MFKILEKLTAKNKKQDDIRMPSHLSAAEQKQVQTVIDRARGDSTVPHSAQDSIPFQRMFPDGICRVTDNYYTKTIQFQDINYQLAQQEDQTAIFEEWCSFLNFFDSSIRFELSFMNTLQLPEDDGDEDEEVDVNEDYEAESEDEPV